MNDLYRYAFFFLLLGLVMLGFDCCKPQPPEVILVPEPETSQNVIDNYYFVKFGWGGNRSEDTIVMQVPDDTMGIDTMAFVWDNELDFTQTAFDYRHEFVRDTSDSEQKQKDMTFIPAVGYHYAPANFFYSRGLEEDFRSGKAGAPSMEEAYNKGDLKLKPIDFSKNEGDLGDERYHRNIFHLAFPFVYYEDTLPYWDIQDYIRNPALKEGSVPWGRVGTQTIEVDTFTVNTFNQNAFNGVVISYIDQFQVEWRTDNEPNFQNGSYFQIDDIIHNQLDGESYWIIEGQFAATLYNDLRESRKCQAGEFRMRIIDDVELAPQPE